MLRKKNAALLLIELRKGPRMMTELKSVVSGYDTLRNLVRDLEDIGLLVREETFEDKRKINVYLTEKGEIIAKQLSKAEEDTTGIPEFEEIVMPESQRVKQAKARVYAKRAEEWKLNFNEATKGLSMLYHVNVMEDHVTIGEKTATGERVLNIYVKVNGHGILRLWCEEDESFECIHVQYAWTLPDVQEMYFNQVNSGNVRKE